MSRLRLVVLAIAAVVLAAVVLGPMFFGDSTAPPEEPPTTDPTPTDPGTGTPGDGETPDDGDPSTPDDPNVTPTPDLPPPAAVEFTEQSNGELTVEVTNITSRADYVVVLCSDVQEENRLFEVGDAHTCTNLTEGDRVEAFAWFQNSADKLGERYYGGVTPTPEPTPTPTPEPTPVYTPTPTPEPGPEIEATFISEYLHDGELQLELDTMDNADYARVYCDADSTRSIRLDRIGETTTCTNLSDGDEVRLTAVLNGEEAEIRIILYEEEFAPDYE